MKTQEITPLKENSTHRLSVPGSKSYTNRALIMAALTKGKVCLENPLYSDDTKAMIECLRDLGLKIEMLPDQLIIHNDIACIEDKNYELFAHDSGTTVRFMLALLCIVPGTKVIGGSQRLNERPIRDLVEALRDLGAKIEYCVQEGELPVKISSSTLFGSAVGLKSDVSSQFCSAILLISPYLAHELTIHIQGALISKPYIDMTVEAMQDAGVEVEIKENGNYFVAAHQFYKKQRYLIEGDFSSAGYFFAMAVLTKSTFTIMNLNPSSMQADRKFLDFLSQMGNVVKYEENAVSVQGKQLAPLDINMEDCPDQVMTMAVLAAFTKGVTQIKGVRSLRVKETERVLAIKNELGKMGIRTEDTPDTLTIYGGDPQAAAIDTYNDHRIAMAFTVAGTILPGMIIRHPDVVNKTFPAFWEALKNLQ